MNYGLADALSQIKPAELSADRFAKQQTQMLQLKDMYTRDQNANAEAEAKYQEQLGLVQENINLLSETGRAEMQAVIKSNKEAMAKEVAKFGNMDAFMRNGGARIIGEYKNNILADDRFYNHKKATEGLAQIDQLLAEGHGDKISQTTLRDIEKYKSGMIETFDPIIINPLIVPDKKYPEDLGIAVKSFMGENYAALKANYMQEFKHDPTDTELEIYTENYYGMALGSKVNQQKIAREKAAARQKNGTNSEFHRFSDNVVEVFSSMRNKSNIAYNDPKALKRSIEEGNYQLGIPYEFQKQFKMKTESGNKPTEMYQMNESFAGKLNSDYMTNLGKSQNEDGTYSFRINEMYDENGLYQGGEETHDTYGEDGKFNGEFQGIFMVLGNENIENPQTGESFGTIFMQNDDGDFQDNIDGNKLNPDGTPVTGYPMQMAMFKDPETGKIFYKQMETSDAAAAGVMGRSWGEMNIMDDEIENAELKKQKNQYVENWDDKQQANARAVFDQSFRASVNTNLAIAGLPMGTGIMGGYIASLVEANIRANYKDAKGDQYDDLFKGLFPQMQKDIFRALNDPDNKDAVKLKNDLAMSSGDKESRDILSAYLTSKLGQGEEINKSYKKFINIFNKQA